MSGFVGRPVGRSNFWPGGASSPSFSSAYLDDTAVSMTATSCFVVTVMLKFVPLFRMCGVSPKDVGTFDGLDGLGFGSRGHLFRLKRTLVLVSGAARRLAFSVPSGRSRFVPSRYFVT